MRVPPHSHIWKWTILTDQKNGLNRLAVCCLNVLVFCAGGVSKLECTALNVLQIVVDTLFSTLWNMPVTCTLYFTSLKGYRSDAFIAQKTFGRLKSSLCVNLWNEQYAEAYQLCLNSQHFATFAILEKAYALSRRSKHLCWKWGMCFVYNSLEAK